MKPINLSAIAAHFKTSSEPLYSQPSGYVSPQECILGKQVTLMVSDIGLTGASRFDFSASVSNGKPMNLGGEVLSAERADQLNAEYAGADFAEGDFLPDHDNRKTDSFSRALCESMGIDPDAKDPNVMPRTASDQARSLLASVERDLWNTHRSSR